MKESIEKQVHDFAEMCYTEGYNDGRVDGCHDAIYSTTDSYGRGINDAWECAKKIISSKEEGGIPTDILQRLFGLGWYDTIKNIPAIDAIAKIKRYEEKKYEESCLTCRHDGFYCDDCINYSKYERSNNENNKIKVGTRVRTLKDTTEYGGKLFPIGTIGKVTSIDKCDTLPYLVEANGDCWWYSKDMFEILPEDEIVVGDEVVLTHGRTVIVSRIGNYDNDWYAIFKDGSSGCILKEEIQKRTGRYFPQITELLDSAKETESEDKE